MADVNWSAMAIRKAISGESWSDKELLEMFADERNWIQVHSKEHGPMKCWWSWNGPTIPPFEILRRHLKEK